MPRSGSTWLYNAARLLLQSRYGDGVGGGWVGDWPDLRRTQVLLLKIHDFDGYLARHAACVLYSFRDVRDALASQYRMFGLVPTVERARKLLVYDSQWRSVANHVMRYETMRGDSRAEVAALARVLDLPDVDSAAIAAQLCELRSPQAEGAAYDPVSLLHPGHITDGRPGGWRSWLPTQLSTELETHYRQWFLENGYGPDADRR